MTVEFPDGVLLEAVRWLQQNVGTGNIYFYGDCMAVQPGLPEEFDWYYERKESWITPDDRHRKVYTAVITVHDPELALVFSLKFSK